jgi:hypothetical protein
LNASTVCANSLSPRCRYFAVRGIPTWISSGRVGEHTELRLADADDRDAATELSLYDQLHQD